MDGYFYLTFFNFLLDGDFSETFSSLKFTSAVKNIKNASKRNEVNEKYFHCHYLRETMSLWDERQQVGQPSSAQKIQGSNPALSCQWLRVKSNIFDFIINIGSYL